MLKLGIKVSKRAIQKFCRLAERSLQGDFVAWFRYAPRLQGILRPFIVERARKFNQAEVALEASLIWARYCGFRKF